VVEDLSEVVMLLNILVLCALAIASLRQWHRQRSDATGWVAVAFAALALLFLSRRLLPDKPNSEVLWWLDKVAIALGVAFPYFLYRFANSLRAWHPRVEWLITVLTGIVVAWSLLLPRLPVDQDPRPAWFQLYIAVVLVHWTLLSVLVALRLWTAGKDQPGVARRRMRLLSVASLLLSLTILVAGAGSSETLPGVVLGVRLASLLSAAMFFVGFIPPAILRTVWRRPEEEASRKGTRDLMTSRSREEVFGHLLPRAIEIVGGQGAAVVDHDGVVVACHGLVPGKTRTMACPEPESESARQDADSAAVSLQLSFGTLLIWASQYTPYFGDEEDDLLRSLGTLAEVSLERVRVSEREARLAAIVESSDDGIISQTVDGTILSWNVGAELLYGYAAEEMVGRSISMIVPPEILDDPDKILGRIRHGERINSYETVRIRKDGKRIDVALTVSPTKDATGKIDGASTIARDITQRKQLERELAAAHDEAVRTSRLKSDFVANMSHEIRTPLNGVIGMTALLYETDLSPEQEEYAETIRSSGEALLTVINDILDFSKIEAGHMDLEEIEFDVRSTVEEAADLVAERAFDKGLELSTFVELDVPRGVRGDPGRLRQVLLNLLGNAVKFTQRGEVVARVGVAEVDEENVRLRFEVTDTGIGIPPETREKLFHSFTQADTSTTRKFGGTGLGLTISRQLVELMGGEIGVQSEVGNGSRFWFTVYLPTTSRSFGPPRETPPNLAGLRVLVVDDNATNRLIFQEMLSGWDMKPAVAESAAQALTMLRDAGAAAEPYRLAIIDFQMPEMDGIALARAIKQDAAIDSVRLILATSSGRRGEAQAAVDAGISAYLTKPVRQSTLFDRIVQVMEPRRDEAAGAPSERDRLPEEKAVKRGVVLVAEDNPVNQKVAVRMLEKMGYHADVAANGREALEAVSRIPYAAVLMDCQMPEMDGYEATRRIRAMNDAASNVPIIAMTADAMKGDDQRVRDAGMDDYVPKPVDQEQLANALDHWVSTTRRHLARKP
jgi:PAS domain S-box-containing protein